MRRWRGRAPIWPNADVFRLRRIEPDLEVAVTAGAGHFQQLDGPDQVNPMIERFLAASLRSADA